MSYPSIFYIALFVFIGVVIPYLGVTGGTKTRDLLIASPQLRISIYKQTILMLLAITGMVLLAMFFNNDSVVKIGAGFLLDAKSFIVLIIICLFFLILLQVVNPGARLLTNLGKSYSRVMYIVPANLKQYRWSILVSFVAGFSEEIIFRGFLFNQASAYLPVIPSILLVNLIFGLCHWGTGIKNASYSFGLGVFFSITFLLTGSLWLAVLTHVMIDLMSMSMGYKTSQHHDLSPEIESQRG